MKSVMSHSFSRVPKAEISRSQFARNHGYKTTFDVGDLVPIYVDEALPGDTFNVKMAAFGRLSTPLAPIMDNMFLETFFFAVPLRLLQNNFVKLMGEQVDPGDSIDYLVPTMTSPAVTGYGEMSLSDYLGIPTKVAGLTHSSYWHRAYNKIFNEWFRDENLQDSLVVDLDDGPDDPADYVIKKRGKRHDYFTSCLPWPQKGEAVLLPLGTSAPIYGTMAFNNSEATGNIANVLDAPGGDLMNLRAGATYVYGGDAPVGSTQLLADLTNATASTINELRQSFQVQKMLEKDARGGTRYIEVIKTHFNVTSDDARLQRSEYLGGGSSMVNIHPVAQTSETGTTPQGTLTGFGTVSVNGHGFVKSFTEHCVLIGLANVRGDITYQQGLDRMFSRSTRYDFYWPSLAHIGEQSVLNKEIYADASANDDLVFGYQERYAEYRYKNSKVTGLFRSNATASLDFWHLAEDFSALPVLNGTFIQDATPVDRVVATPSEPNFILDAYFTVKTARPMPVYSVPGLIDHF